MKNADLERLRALAEPLAQSMGLTLWGIELASVPGRSVVRVYVDVAPASGDPSGVPASPEAASADAEAARPLAETPRGVDVEQCARLSRALSVALDVEDFMPGAYALEVSSPGLDRPFFTPAQAADHAGQTVEVRLHEPREGRKNFKGVLQHVRGDVLTVEVDGREESFVWDAVKKARLVYDFGAPAPQGRRGR